MDKQNIKEKLAEIMSAVFEKNVKPEDNFCMESDSEWTSLKHIELMVTIEEEFNVTLNPADIPDLISKEKIENKLSELL